MNVFDVKKYPLGNFPTPLERMSNLEKYLGVPNLFIKPPDDARPAESKDGAVSNLLEVGFRSTAEVRATKKEEME